jgi:hypothetical protein
MCNIEYVYLVGFQYVVVSIILGGIDFMTLLQMTKSMRIA